MLLAETLAILMVVAVVAALMAGYPVALTLAGVSLIFAIAGQMLGVMNKRNRAIDFRMVVENSGSIDFFGNEFCDRRRAIHRRQNADVVPCAGFSIGPDIAFECRTELRRENLVVFCALGKFVVAGEIAKCHVLLMSSRRVASSK